MSWERLQVLFLYLPGLSGISACYFLVIGYAFDIILSFANHKDVEDVLASKKTGQNLDWKMRKGIFHVSDVK